MILLLTGIQGYEDMDNIGWLTTPRSRDSIDRIIESKKPWACDNDAFSAWDAERYLRMIDRVAGQPRMLFVTAPDVVGDHDATLKQFWCWADYLRSRDIPIAFVLQDGCTPYWVPWEAIAAVFIGGSTEWKLGPNAAAIVHEAKERGKWVHMGRVNSSIRMDYARTIGCDSCDGTQWVRWRDRYKPLARKALARHRNLGLSFIYNRDLDGAGSKQ